MKLLPILALVLPSLLPLAAHADPIDVLSSDTTIVDTTSTFTSSLDVTPVLYVSSDTLSTLDVEDIATASELPVLSAPVDSKIVIDTEVDLPSTDPTSSNSPVPEPGSLALLSTGLLGVAGALRRRSLA